MSRCPTDPMTYSDNSTQTCVAVCPDTPDFYAANSSQRCVYHCDDETYAD